MPTLPAVSFWKPYWELCFQEKLVLGDYAVKTFNVPYNHRGPILCHTGRKAAPGPMHAYGLSDEDVSVGVVGCAYVVDCRELNDDEKQKLFIGYNDRFMKGIGGFPSPIPSDAVYAMSYGVFIPLSRLHRFKRPFVPPVQHVFGPRARIPLYPEIERQLPKWAKRESTHGVYGGEGKIGAPSADRKRV